MTPKLALHSLVLLRMWETGCDNPRGGVADASSDIMLNLGTMYRAVWGLFARIVMGMPGCLGRTIIDPETRTVSLHGSFHIPKDSVFLAWGRKDQPMAPQGHSHKGHEG